MGNKEKILDFINLNITTSEAFLKDSIKIKECTADKVWDFKNQLNNLYRATGLITELSDLSGQNDADKTRWEKKLQLRDILLPIIESQLSYDLFLGFFHDYKKMKPLDNYDQILQSQKELYSIIYDIIY